MDLTLNCLFYIRPPLRLRTTLRKIIKNGSLQQRRRFFALNPDI